MDLLKIGSVIENANIETPFRVLEHHPTYYSPDTYLIQNLFTGWTCLAHHIFFYPDGKCEWDFSTNGRFEEVQQ